MGQYHLTVNLTKREFIHPHKLGDGLKLLEQSGWSPGGTNDALHLLLAVSNGRGGGDFPDSEWAGRWGGDRIAVIGDYAEDTDLPAEDHAGEIWGQCHDDEGEGCGFRDITDDLIPALEEAYEIVYYGTGWRNRVDLFKAFGLEATHGGGRDGRIARHKDGQQYLVRDLIAELKQRAPEPNELPLIPTSKPVADR